VPTLKVTVNLIRIRFI